MVGAVFLLAHPVQAYAEVKDTDLDGLSDQSEISIYHTDPNLFDTDGDGIGDGQEILDGTNPLDPKSSRIASIVASDRGSSFDRAQYIRSFGPASGIFAILFLVGFSIFDVVKFVSRKRSERARMDGSSQEVVDAP